MGYPWPAGCGLRLSATGAQVSLGLLPRACGFFCSLAIGLYLGGGPHDIRGDRAGTGDVKRVYIWVDIVNLGL